MRTSAKPYKIANPNADRQKTKFFSVNNPIALKQCVPNAFFWQNNDVANVSGDIFDYTIEILIRPP